MSDQFYLQQERLLLRKDLPKLEAGITALTKDTSQVFIGGDENQSPYINNNRVEISPIPNAKSYVQQLLNASISYKTYYVTDDLHIITESQSKAEEIANFINEKVLTDFTNVKPIARLSTNIELITNLNITEYSNPAYFNVDLTPNIGLSRPDHRVLNKVLDDTQGDIFLEFPRYDTLHIEVHYTLVQNGTHRRSGILTVAADKLSTNETDIGFSDQHSSSSFYSPDHIRFDAVNYHLGNSVRIVFAQPSGDQTKIHYRIQKWGLDGF